MKFGVQMCLNTNWSELVNHATWSADSGHIGNQIVHFCISSQLGQLPGKGGFILLLLLSTIEPYTILL